MNDEKKLPLIGITVGDTNGIGMEVIIKALLDNRILQTCTPVVYGSTRLASYYRKRMELPDFNFQIIQQPKDANIKRPNLINCWDEEMNIEPGQASPEAGRYALASIDAAMKDVLSGQLDAMVTAPVNKHNIAAVHPGFTGHTGYLAEKAGAGQVLMLMVHEQLKMGLVTEHISLKAVPEKLSEELILRKIKVLHQSLSQDFNIRKPRIAVLALNPHAGEGGTLGEEEKTIILPAIRKAEEANILAIGPYAADGFFGSGQWRHFDAVLSMYHDQGLIPFKHIAFSEGVNFTAGLPFVRTSPDHGTGYDIAGKNIAAENSFRQAMFLACDITETRRGNRKLEAKALRSSQAQKHAETRD